MKKWYDASGNDGDIVISSRIRLARNLSKYPFLDRMDDSQKQELNHEVENKLKELNLGDNQLELIWPDQITPNQKSALVEQHLVSPDFVKQGNNLLALSADRSISIMVNEEDHLRIQVMVPGFNLEEAYRLANQCDDFLNESFEYAFDEDLGYLTTCMTNLGTGLRASVMLHLPALESAGALNSIINTVSKLGLTVRGTYGEGSNAYGSLYQISNQITLGISEEQAIDNLKSIVNQILHSEREARQTMLKNNRVEVEDAVYRSYGLLKYARLMSAEEFYRLISDVRLGVSLGIITDLSQETINHLLSCGGDAVLKCKPNTEKIPVNELRTHLLHEAIK